MAIPLIPYGAIGTGLAIILIIMAFFRAGSTGRIIILALVSLTFLLPTLLSSMAVGLICYVGRILIGIGCYIYLKTGK
jgi:hypothetical protein